MKLFNSENHNLYIVCFVCRSGSSWLCEMLGRHGIGFPQEYYYPYGLQERYAYQRKTFPQYGMTFPVYADSSPEEYFRAVLSSQRPIAGIKCSFASLQILYKEVTNQLQLIKPKFIYLTRRDKLQQAISWYRATESGWWSSNDDNSTRKVTYHKAAVDEYLRLIQESEAEWEHFLSDQIPLRLFYEDLSQKTPDLIEEFLGVRGTRRWNTRTQLKVQRDKTTTDWENRYKADCI